MQPQNTHTGREEHFVQGGPINTPVPNSTSRQGAMNHQGVSEGLSSASQVEPWIERVKKIMSDADQQPHKRNALLANVKAEYQAQVLGLPSRDNKDGVE